MSFSVRGSKFSSPKRIRRTVASCWSIVASIDECLSDGRLARKGNKYPTVWPADKPVRRAKSSSADAKPFKARKTTKKKAAPRAYYSPLQGALERYRKNTARRLGWKPYMVFQKLTLVALDEQRPSSLKELEAVPGLGPAKIERFGEDLLRLVRENG